MALLIGVLLIILAIVLIYYGWVAMAAGIAFILAFFGIKGKGN